MTTRITHLQTSNIPGLQRLFLTGLIVLLFLLICFQPLIAAKKNPKSIPIPPEHADRVNALFNRAMDEVDESKFVKSLETIDEIKAIIPEHPAGYLYASAITQWIVKGYRNYSFHDSFFENVDKTLDYSDNLSRLNAWRYIYLGGAYGFRGIQESELGNFFSAFHDGLRGVNRIKRALELDNTIYDSYYGLGTYIFWKAFYLDQFFFLSGDPKDKEKGKKYIEKCIEHCRYTKEVAEASLIRIYNVDQQQQKAIELASKILKRAPNYISVVRQLGHNYFDIKEYDLALETYQRAKNTLLNHRLTHENAIVEINYFLSRTYFEKGNYQEADKIYQETRPLFTKISENIEPMVVMRDNFYELHDNIEKKLASN